MSDAIERAAERMSDCLEGPTHKGGISGHLYIDYHGPLNLTALAEMALAEQSEREHKWLKHKRDLRHILAQAIEYAECNDPGAPWLSRGRALLAKEES